MNAPQLRAIRSRLGLTQKQLAERLLVSVRTIKRWEAGQTPIDALRAREAARLYRRALALNANTRENRF